MARQQLLDRSDLHGDDFCAAYAAAADRWLADLFDAATGGDPHGLALVAVGGYGRGELCPFSDLDVVLVHRGRPDVAQVADAIWYPVWDEGIRLDHSVRAPAEVLAVARDDLRAQLGLLDGRLVAGDAAAVGTLLDDARALRRSQAARWLPVLADQVDERREAHGDVAFLLEPDLKQSHGGLRDIVVISLAAQAVPALAHRVDLAALQDPRAALTAARVELHRSTGRATDRLLLQEQDQVAAAADYADADALMAALAEASRTIAAALDAGVRAFDASTGGIGGCPFAPRATGNVCTEDLAWMLGEMGLEHGIDLDLAIETSRWVGERLGGEPPGLVARAGSFPS